MNLHMFSLRTEMKKNYLFILLDGIPTKFMLFFITEGSVEGEEQVLKVRLSTTSKDVKLPVRSTDTIATAKRKLEVMEHFWWYFSINEFYDYPVKKYCIWRSKYRVVMGWKCNCVWSNLFISKYNKRVDNLLKGKNCFIVLLF